jgi:hypothetical protein
LPVFKIDRVLVGLVPMLPLTLTMVSSDELLGRLRIVVF